MILEVLIMVSLIGVSFLVLLILLSSKAIAESESGYKAVYRSIEPDYTSEHTKEQLSVHRRSPGTSGLDVEKTFLFMPIYSVYMSLGILLIIAIGSIFLYLILRGKLK